MVSRASDNKANQPKVGLALGSGSARGWGHIGIIHELAERGIEPDIVCGCSIGALVGASHVAGNLDSLENWVRGLTMSKVIRFFDLKWSLNGFVDAPRLQAFLSKNVCADGRLIEELDNTFASVATDLETGQEKWFTRGAVLDAVWASIALPGLFPPIQHQNRWLVDGGLVNPVPVSLCRALGADVVIAVNLNGDLLGKHHKPPSNSASNDRSGLLNSVTRSIKAYSDSIFPNTTADETPPSLFEAIAGSINITQDRITRSRMAGDPPDVLLNPKLRDIGLLEYHRAGEAIEEGRHCVQRMLPEIEHVLTHLER